MSTASSIRMGKIFDIHRSNMYEDVLLLFQNEEVMDYYPLRIAFVGEKAIDLGGVCRDMISGFWEEAYRRHFGGSSLLAPVIHAQTNMSEFVTLGKVLSHGYLLKGYLPVRVAFPSLASMILGQIDIPDKILVSSFADSLSYVECQLLKTCLNLETNSFSANVQAKLVNLLSRFGSRQLPTPSNLRQQIIQVAKFEFVTKPVAAHTLIHTGISHSEKIFWNQLTVNELYSLYVCLTATPDRLLDFMEEPIFINPAQERVYGYLRDFIGNLSINDTRTFLRFTTGSAVLTSAPLKVIFNNVAGLARRPIAHTCDNTLEISPNYSSHNNFKDEFMAILSDKDYSWCMDLY